jgi:hypothetical protein
MPTPVPARRKRLLLLLAPFDLNHRDLIAMTLAWMAEAAGYEFDLYYAADREQGGLFAKHGSTVVGGHHAARIARALVQFDTTIVRPGSCSILRTLTDGNSTIDATDDLAALYSTVASRLGIPLPREVVVYDAGTDALPTAALFPESVFRRALAVPSTLEPARIRALHSAGVRQAWTVTAEGTDLAEFAQVGIELRVGQSLDDADPALAVAQRWLERCNGVDLYEPIVAAYMLPFNIRERRLILPYVKREEGVVRRDQMLSLTNDRPQPIAYGRWFGDLQLEPLAKVPTPYNVVEPCRQILTVFARDPRPLPQPPQSWIDLEPTDEQLRIWAGEQKVLASWILHSGELSHDDAVLTFFDWSSMTKVKIGAGVFWQRYYTDPDAVELMHVPVSEGGVLGLVEPVLHSTGAGIVWETAADASRLAAIMVESRRRIADLAGERFAPRGVYFFGDFDHGRMEPPQPTERQLDLWKAARDAGFEYVITSALAGPSRILYRDGDFVALSQAAEHHFFSPFRRGTPDSFAMEEKRLNVARLPGWLIGALDSPIQGNSIYVGRPKKVGHNEQLHRISSYYDYIEGGGTRGKIISATPRTIARYARLLADLGLHAVA